MLSETILEMSYCQLNFGKNKLKLGTDFHIWVHWPKIKKDYKLRHCGLLGVLNALLALSYPGGKDYDKKSYDS